jgi:hypothetical protein
MYEEVSPGGTKKSENNLSRDDFMLNRMDNVDKKMKALEAKIQKSCKDLELSRKD